MVRGGEGVTRADLGPRGEGSAGPDATSGACTGLGQRSATRTQVGDAAPRIGQAVSLPVLTRTLSGGITVTGRHQPPMRSARPQSPASHGDDGVGRRALAPRCQRLLRVPAGPRVPSGL